MLLSHLDSNGAWKEKYAVLPRFPNWENKISIQKYSVKLFISLVYLLRLEMEGSTIWVQNTQRVSEMEDSAVVFILEMYQQQ